MAQVSAGYKIEQLLEEWADGALYAAYQESLQRKILLRLDRLPHDASGAAKERHLAAARKLGALNHPNIVRVVEVGETKEGVFCAMEYPGDLTLDRRMNEQGALPPQETAGAALHVLAALEFASSQENIAHGSLRPHVIFMTQDGFVKVAEFGMERKRSRMQLGRDAQYVPPEKVAGGFVDERSDIYSLGAIMYRAMSGRLLFPDIDPKRVLARQVEEAPVPLEQVSPSIPPELAAIVETAIRKDPRKRYQTPGQMAAALKAVKL